MQRKPPFRLWRRRGASLAPVLRQQSVDHLRALDRCGMARRRGELVSGYLRSSAIVHVPFRNPPGFLSVDDNARLLRGELLRRRRRRALEQH